MNVEEYRRWLRQLVATYETQAEAAKALGISPQHLGDVIAMPSRRDPGPAIMRATGFTRMVAYVEIAKARQRG